jgi:hypothetical protein
MKEVILATTSAEPAASLDPKDILAQPTQGGRHPFFAQGWFGWLVVAVIAVVAAAAGAAWWQLYHEHWPDGIVGWIEAAGLGAGIIAQPIFAAMVTTQA